MISPCVISKQFYLEYIVILKKRKLKHRNLPKFSQLVDGSPVQHDYTFAFGQIFGGRVENGCDGDKTGGRGTSYWIIAER